MSSHPSRSVTLLAAFLLSACSTATTTSMSVSPGAPASASPEPPDTPEPSASASESASPELSPSEDNSDAIAADDIVIAQVDGLRIRETPGLDGLALGSLASGYQSIVVDGPELADGLEWYQIAGLGIPNGSGCVTGPDPTNPYICPTWLGWASRAGADGSVWLEEIAPDCADPQGPLNDFAYQPRYLYVACYGDGPISLHGHVIAYQNGPECTGIPADLLWLACSPWGELASSPGVVGLPMTVPPGDSLAGGGEVSVQGHFDDSAAAGCTYGDEPERSMLDCRSLFVVDSAAP